MQMGNQIYYTQIEAKAQIFIAGSSPKRRPVGQRRKKKKGQGMTKPTQKRSR